MWGGGVFLKDDIEIINIYIFFLILIFISTMEKKEEKKGGNPPIFLGGVLIVWEDSKKFINVYICYF